MEILVVTIITLLSLRGFVWGASEVHHLLTKHGI